MKKILIGLLIFIFISLAALTCYKLFIYDDTKPNDDNTEETESIEDISTALIERFKYFYFDDLKEDEITYMDSYDVSNSNEIMYDIAYYYIMNADFEDFIANGITKTKLKDALLKLYGSNFKVEYPEYLSSSDCKMVLDKEVYKREKACTGVQQSYIAYKIINTEKTNNGLEISVKFYNSYMEFNDKDEIIKITYYSDGNRKNVIGTDEDLNNRTNQNELFGKSDTYKFTFIKDGKNYTFKSMEKQKDN